MKSDSPLQKVNLLPKDAFEASVLGKVLRWSLTVGRVLVVLTEFVVIIAFLTRFWFDKRSNDLTELIDQKQMVVQSYVEIEKEMRQLLLRQKPADRMLEEGFEVAEGIDRLTSLLPVGVVLDQISFREDGVGIAGLAGSEQSLAQAIAAMKSYQGVAKVSVNRIEFDQKRGGVSFEIISQFEEKDI